MVISVIFFLGFEGADGSFKKYVQVQELVYWRTLLSAPGNDYLNALPEKSVFHLCVGRPTIKLYIEWCLSLVFQFFFSITLNFIHPVKLIEKQTGFSC